MYPTTVLSLEFGLKWKIRNVYFTSQVSSKFAKNNLKIVFREINNKWNFAKFYLPPPLLMENSTYFNFAVNGDAS